MDDSRVTGDCTFGAGYLKIDQERYVDWKEARKKN